MHLPAEGLWIFHRIRQPWVGFKRSEDGACEQVVWCYLFTYSVSWHLKGSHGGLEGGNGFIETLHGGLVPLAGLHRAW